jgi:hypothetical protein
MKSIVTKVTRFDKVDSYNNWSYLVEFKNGDRGYYSTKSQEQNKFVANQEAEYEIEEKIGKNDKTWWKITVPGEKQPFKPGGSGKPQVEPRIQMISFTASYIKDLVVADKVKMEDFEKQFNRIYSLLTSKI